MSRSTKAALSVEVDRLRHANQEQATVIGNVRGELERANTQLLQETSARIIDATNLRAAIAQAAELKAQVTSLKDSLTRHISIGDARAIMMEIYGIESPAVSAALDRATNAKELLMVAIGIKATVAHAAAEQAKKTEAAAKQEKPVVLPPEKKADEWDLSIGPFLVVEEVRKHAISIIKTIREVAPGTPLKVAKDMYDLACEGKEVRVLCGVSESVACAAQERLSTAGAYATRVARS